jgi:hypothetical protein
MSKDNALAFVGQIMTAYKAIVKAEGSALHYAIECGEALNLAKENVESTRPKGKWKDWLAEHCKEIPPRTERLYRQLASAVTEDADIFTDCVSIRDAVKKLNQPDDGDSNNDDEESESDDEESDEEESGSALPLAASPDLTSMLEHCAVDEVGKALQDAGMLGEFEAAVFSWMSPDAVCVALIEAWDTDQLSALTDRLVTHLRSLNASAKELAQPKELAL